MTEAQIDLSRRAMALPGFRWCPGMLLLNGWALRADDTVSAGDGLFRLTEESRIDTIHPRSAPVITDPATGGALVGLLGFEARRVMPCASQHKYADGERWRAVATLDVCDVWCEHLAEAACHVAISLGGWSNV